MIKWCSCDFYWINQDSEQDGLVICSKCGGMIECDYCEQQVPATVVVVRTPVCDLHEDAANDVYADLDW